ncbi:hypothetical protein CRENBAI_015787 [Crenichthys baileyi]|uniref:Uncharacterized protein n=1 Tax=Crenichthys baileyi TaxID=28760 RepID=A0AAV9RJE4_9TELE
MPVKPACFCFVPASSKSDTTKIPRALEPKTQAQSDGVEIICDPMFSSLATDLQFYLGLVFGPFPHTNMF